MLYMKRTIQSRPASIIYTIDREIFVLKIFRALKFHGAKFS